MIDARSHSPNGANLKWLALIPILSLLISFGAGYGGSKYAEGETHSKLIELERRVQVNSEAISKMNDRTVSRDEMKQFIDSTRSDLGEIKTDIRAMRGLR